MILFDGIKFFMPTSKNVFWSVSHVISRSMLWLFFHATFDNCLLVNLLEIKRQKNVNIKVKNKNKENEFYYRQNTRGASLYQSDMV